MTGATALVHDAARWSFLVPAAGAGERLGAGPKCLLELGGETLWRRAVRRARRVANDVVLAVPEDLVREIAATGPPCRVIAGGATRQETIANLLAAANRERILIHDVARPFGSRALMLAVAVLADGTGAAACLARCDAPVVGVAHGELTQAIDFPDLGLAESPLAFHRAVLQDAYRRAGADGFTARSTVELVRHAGHAIHFVASERDNFKITHPADLRLATLLVAARAAQNEPGS